MVLAAPEADGVHGTAYYTQPRPTESPFRPHGPAETALERIMMDRSHLVASVHHVNPLDINKIEQIHAIDRIAKAIPINPDLL